MTIEKNSSPLCSKAHLSTFFCTMKGSLNPYWVQSQLKCHFYFHAFPNSQYKFSKSSIEYGPECVENKETKGRSSGQTPFTIKPKQLALKKTIFTPKKYFLNFFKNFFTFVSSNFLVRTLQCKEKIKIKFKFLSMKT